MLHSLVTSSDNLRSVVAYAVAVRTRPFHNCLYAASDGSRRARELDCNKISRIAIYNIFLPDGLLGVIESQIGSLVEKKWLFLHVGIHPCKSPLSGDRVENHDR